MLIEFVQYFFPALGMMALGTFVVGLILSVAGHIERRRAD